ncbi:MAG: SRPBCC family protein [Dehalococcoidia bacterium]
MAIELQETFQVGAPIDAVWSFVMDAEQVAACMPGAALDEVVDERTFLGSIQVKLGAITTSYKGRVQFVEVDAAARVVRMQAAGREAGGGTAKGLMSSRLESLPDGQTQVIAEATVEVTGRIAQMGRGMIQGVSHQLFQQFVACAKAHLEAPAEEGAPAAAAQANQPIHLVPLVFGVIWSAIAAFFRRLLRRPAA